MNTNTNTWSMQAAKNQFCQLAKVAYTGTPQYITKRGMPMVAVVNAEYLRSLENKAKPSFVDFLLSMPKDDGEFEKTEVHPREVQF